MNSRREFLMSALGASAVLLSAACGGAAQPAAPAKPTTAPAAQPTAAPAAAAKPTAPANLSGATVSLLQWNHFIPTADPFFKQQADDWAKQTGVNVTVET